MQWSKGLIATWAVTTFLLVGVVIVFVVIKIQVDTLVEQSSELCSKNAPSYDYFKDPPTQNLEVWVYNISNPGLFLSGDAGAELHEKGPYSFNLDVNRANIRFYDGNSQVSFTLFNKLNFNQGGSCIGCESIFSEKVSVINPVYSAMLSGAGSEFNMLLATSCTPQQVANMVRNPTAPYCEKTDLTPNLNANCRCCVPDVTTLNMTDIDPDGSLAYCSDLTDPYGAKASLISWLASYDGGYKLSNIVTPTSFPLSSGLYTPLVRTYTINEMISGSVSALAGLFNYAAFSSATDEESVASVESILTTTQDIKDVCYSSNFDFCPSLTEIMLDLGDLVSMPERFSYLRNINCPGQVPNYDTLVAEGGFTEERAKELRYLEGVPCQQFAVAVAFSALVMLSPANTATCADGGSMPCCTSQFSLNNGAQVGKGIGCLRFVDGLMQKRRVFSGEEAERYLGSTVVHKTSCANTDPLTIGEWFGEETLIQWFTPATYTYPNMPWADPVILNNAGGAVAGEFTTFDVSGGRVVTQMLGTGAGKSFLQKQLNGGGVVDEEFDIFLPGLNRIHTIKYDGNDEFEGLRVAKYSLTSGETEPSATTQGNGQNPYPNMVNMYYYTDGIPAVLSLINFNGVDEAIYTQSNNLKRGYTGNIGVTLYRTHENYNAKSPQIDPVQITIETIQQFRDDYSVWWEFEPATGLTITNQIGSMFSLFSLNCNPLLDPTCTFAREESDELCYPTTIGGETVTSPCSNANVFTPKVQAEKVYPMFWNRVSADPPEEELEIVITVLNVRYAFSVLCIVVPGLFLILVSYTVFLYLRSKDPVNNDSGRGSVIDMTFRKPHAEQDREISIVDEKKNPLQN